MAQRAIVAPVVQANPSHWPLVMLVHRFVLFLAWQAVIALGHALAGAPDPWQASIAWWPISATLTNLISVGLLHFRARQEGLRWSQLLGADFRREHIGKDLLALLGLLLLAGPVAMIPNLGLSHLLFGNIEAASQMFILPLPMGVALAAFLFPVTIALAELPTYFGYVMPRLATRWGPAWALGLATFWLGAQHMTLPLIFDARFMFWRLAMFIPFALMLGLAIRWRPRLLPYLMVTHGLIDVSVTLMVWQASVGG